MAKFGLQTEFLNRILKRYFGGSVPNMEENELYIGLGLTQDGANVNTETFDEVSNGQSVGNYQRARVVFGRSVNNTISNSNEVIFTTASEDWTDGNHKIEMLGIFDTPDLESKNPLVVIPLPRYETVIKGETIILAENTIQFSLTDF